jgi:hypothetical protein
MPLLRSFGFFRQTATNMTLLRSVGPLVIVQFHTANDITHYPLPVCQEVLRLLRLFAAIIRKV